MAGRKPLPTQLKLVKGTARKGRMNADEPRPDLGIPAAPDHLNPYALMEWGRITPVLYRMGLLTDLDMAALAAYCVCYARWKEAEEKINRTGLMIKTTNGNAVQSPLVGIANRSLDLMGKFLAEFGLSPSSRSRVTATENKKQESKFGAFGGGK